MPSAPSSGGASQRAGAGSGGNAVGRIRAGAESGLVIVDEEHDGSYKQQETPRYHGRDVAIVRARRGRGGVGAWVGHAQHREPLQRGCRQVHTAAASRSVSRSDRCRKSKIVDMRVEFLETKRQATFSRKLLEEMEQRLGQGEQTMLLLNRRGFSSFMVCRACGERLPVRQLFGRADAPPAGPAHAVPHCGYAEKVPTACPKCGSDHIQFLGHRFGAGGG